MFCSLYTEAQKNGSLFKCYCHMRLLLSNVVNFHIMHVAQIIPHRYPTFIGVVLVVLGVPIFEALSLMWNFRHYY